MTIKVGINGFGRMGRLSLRAAFDWTDVKFVKINEPAGDAKTLAHLLNFDSIHGRWHHQAEAEVDSIIINNQQICYSQQYQISFIDLILLAIANR